MIRRVKHCLIALTAALSLAAADSTASLEKYTPAERRHWAFQKITRPVVPQFTAAAERAWSANPIDAFILARLKKEGLRPAPRADRATLIRRVTFDLTGLPPTPAEIDAFIRDTSPNAYRAMVDRLIASPQYGERWAQHWLDVVRFAESDGFEYDTHRREAWRYRDYVIRSFNRDKPYDRFLREQLAGDELDTPDEEPKIAAGFNRLGPLRKNAGNQEVASSANEVLMEMTNIVGSALLGVTLGCARCHDHKFDPIRHTDYYRIQAYFAATHSNDVPLSSEQERTAWAAKTAAVENEMKAIKGAMKGLKGDALQQMEKKLADAEATLPLPLPTLYSVKSDAEKVIPIHVLARGDYQAKGARVGMRPLGVLLPDGAPEMAPDTPRARTLLVDWIVDPANPLPSRVLANRLWHRHFGRGLVATPNDFGRMGTRPSHPELLDWMATKLVEGGWRVKALDRMIVLSNSYQQASTHAPTPAARENDPENKLLWRFSRRRLSAEEIRDAALAVSGRLNPKAGGPSVIVPVEKELVGLLYKPSQWSVTPDAAEHDRRSVYLIAKRNLRLPMLEVFDAPDLQTSCGRRESSTHAPQALELLNGDLANRAADALATRLEFEAGADRRKQVRLAYRLAAGRLPSVREERLALDFLAAQPLREFALSVLNLNAFLYVN